MAAGLPSVPLDSLRSSFVDIVTRVAKDAMVTPVDGTAYAEVQVAGPRGIGRVQLEVGRYGGTATDAADTDVFVYGNCEPPQRKGVPNGTVLQLYAPDGYSLPMQHLRAFGPTGQLLKVTTLSRGDQRLPLDEAQLAKVGLLLGTLG
jgi:hypothetical protein